MSARLLQLLFRSLAACLFMLSPLCGAQTLQPTEALALVTVKGAAPTQSEVVLPYHWDRRHGGLSGTAEFAIPFVLAAEPGEVYGIYFLRIGNAYEVWLNGTLLQRNGDLTGFDGEDYAKVPHFVPAPANLLRRENVLKVRLRADGGRRGGLAAPVVGPDKDVRQLFESEYRWRVVGSFAVVVFSLLIGLGGMLLWLTQVDIHRPDGHRRDSVYLFAGIAELAWALRVADAIIEQPPLPWLWWATLQTTALAVWFSSMAVFCLKLADWDDDPRCLWFKRSLAFSVLAGCAAAYLSHTLDRNWVLTSWFVAAVCLFAGFGTVFIVAAIRSGSTAHRMIAFVIAVNIIVGLRDVAVFRFGSSFGDNTLTRYSSVSFGLILAYVLITRFSAATAQARDLMRNLERKVSAREAQLRVSYEQLETMAREQERTAERGRILRDMHDGVGAHITSAIRQLQSGKADPGDVLQTLRESLDHLKLTIDAMNIPPGDVTALLANLRYRLEPRLAASDIQLRWEVNVIDPLPELDSVGMRHLQFIVFEALSNVLQHARASVIRIEAGVCEGGARVRLTDNGRGFNAQLVHRKGLQSMHERARAIGARLLIESTADGTGIEIVLGSGAQTCRLGDGDPIPGQLTIQE